MTNYLDTVATVPFVLARPEDLPGTAAELEEVRPAASSVVESLSELPARASLAGLLAAIRRASGTVGGVASALIQADPSESAANRDNDLAFGIERHRGDAARLLVSAALAAYEGLIELTLEQGSGLAQDEWQDLVSGFDVLIGWMATTGRVPLTPPVPEPDDLGEQLPADGLRRWVRGHHVFMVFAQGCAMAISCLVDAYQRADRSDAEVPATVATRLMRASRGALCFAGNSTDSQYRAEIRPTLMPPIAPPRMSGLRWRDHEALVAALGASKRAWAWLAESTPEHLARFREALDDTYAAHKGVCQHFVGTSSPSLLATSRSERPAVSVLDQFHRIRAQSLPDLSGSTGGDR